MSVLNSLVICFKSVILKVISSCEYFCLALIVLFILAVFFNLVHYFLGGK